MEAGPLALLLFPSLIFKNRVIFYLTLGIIYLKAASL